MTTLRLRTSLLLPAFALATFGCGDSANDDTNADEAADATSQGDGDGDTGETGDTGEQLGPTWHQDIAPIVAEKCVGCHRDESIAPFALDDYASASAWAELAFDAMVNNEMPPWAADETNDCQPNLALMNDPRLTDEQLDLFEAWIAAGVPEGDPATAAPLPEPPSLALPDADYDLPLPSNIEIGPGADQLWCFVIDPGFTDDVFIEGVQIEPGNDKILHHALVYVDEAGESEALADANGRYECFGGPEVAGSLIAVWAPGMPAEVTPEGVAFEIPAGAKLVMQVHYHPTGANEIDEGTRFVMREAAEQPAYVAAYSLPGNEDSRDNSGFGLQPGPNDQGDPEFRIPAGVAGHTETMAIPIPPEYPELRVWAVGAHMHYLGVDMRLELDRFKVDPDTGIDEECFLQTPYYDFNWQRTYRYEGTLADMPVARPGDLLRLECTFDNSMANQNLVEALAEQGLDAPIDVYLGEETLDEMCLGVFGIAALYEP